MSTFLPQYQKPTRWILKSNGEATCLQDYEGMHAPVVELLRKEDLALAVHYLNPTISESRMEELYDEGSKLESLWDLIRMLTSYLAYKWPPNDTEHLSTTSRDHGWVLF